MVSLRVDKGVFWNVDFVRQNPMLVKSVDKSEYGEITLKLDRKNSEKVFAVLPSPVGEGGRTEPAEF